MLVTVGNRNQYRKGHSELFTVTDHQVMKNYWIWLTCVPCVTDGYRYRYKVKNNIRLKHIADLFRRTDTKYLLRNEEFVIPRLNTITHGKHSIRYIGSNLWNLLPKKDKGPSYTIGVQAAYSTAWPKFPACWRSMLKLYSVEGVMNTLLFLLSSYALMNSFDMINDVAASL